MRAETLVKGFVELHGGTVTIESGERGTIVRCHLPTGQTPAALAATPEEATVH